MKKLKALGILFLLAVCTGIFALTAFAENSLSPLDTPSLVRWSNTEEGFYLYFEEVEEANGLYAVRAQKEGKTVFNFKNSRSNPISGGRLALWALMDFEMDKLGTGDYTFQVKALGDQKTTADSEWSEWSRPFHYVKPAKAFGEVQNLHWLEKEASETEASLLSLEEDPEYYYEEGDILEEDPDIIDEDGEAFYGYERASRRTIIAWDPPANMAEIPQENRESLRYYVRLYKGGGTESVYGMYNVTDTELDITSWINGSGKGTYTVSVQAQSRLINGEGVSGVAHGKSVRSDAYIDTAEIAQRIGGELSDILDQMNSEEDNPLASPSNALAAVDKLDIRETAIAVQSEDSVLSILRGIEDLYLRESGGTVEKQISEDAGFGEEDVDVIGAGLNVASPSNAVALQIEKADTDEIGKLDSGFYSHAVVYEISLKNAVGSLRTPVTIFMPVPEGIEPKSLRILHYHSDGSDEVIYPMITDDGRAKFTVTKFSRFVFVQNSIPEYGNDEPEKDPGSSGRPGGSGGGGGGGSKSAGSSASGIVTTDSKKGQVNSVTGIITGSGEGYSRWVSDTLQDPAAEVRWRLQYADGTYAAGSYVTDEQGNPVKDSAGNPVEQPLWEMVDGAWYAFGADGYIRSGLVFDPALNGWFYLDSSTGMKTGWQQIGEKWYYFNPASDGTKGILFTSCTTPDGYYVQEDGSWDGQERK